VILFISLLYLGDVVIADYIIVFDTFIIFIVVYFLFRYGLVVRTLINQQPDAGYIIKPVMTSIEKKIDWYNEKILDLLYRVDLLEVKLITSSDMVMSRKSDDVRDRSSGKNYSNISEVEITVLELLRDGSKSSIEVQKRLGKSREHVARVMKEMFDIGYINRDESKRPFTYTLTELGRSLIIVAN